MGKTESGELSLFAKVPILLLSPSIHKIPSQLADIDKRFRNRHVDFRVNENAKQTLRLRSMMVSRMRKFFESRGFLEVETPIFSDTAGGANAQPFTTISRACHNEILEMRIAPELWLKRLIVGGFDRVFEIGKSFRNEGIDHTHNPEFTTLEAYQTFLNLDGLMIFIEALIKDLFSELAFESRNERLLSNLDKYAQFKIVDFVPDLELAMSCSLPDLETLSTVSELQEILMKFNIPPPVVPSVDALLDALADNLLVSKFTGPTFLINQPAAMAPLAKASRKGKHLTSHRLELYIDGMEVSNAYEEENCPVEQAKKFSIQQQTEHISDFAKSYVSALEYGLPPTGGMGIGIDRLCMILAGTDRISETMAFGGLRTAMYQGIDRGGA